VFRRRTSDEPAASGTTTTTGGAATTPGGKGRPTPSRREAEAARRERARPPSDRKSVAQRERAARRQAAAKVRTAMQTGDESHYVGRDRGPIRSFVRDYIDSRRTVAEFLMPILLVVLVLSFLQSPTTAALATLAWMLAMVVIVVDLFVVGRRLRREVFRRFPDDTGKGHVMYGVLRATQMRRLRLPKPKVRPGATV
jgi:hypothetical protein